MDDHRKRFYFIETTKTRKENYLGDSIPEEKKTKIYVMPVSDVNPDWKMYTKRISDRAEILMEPLVDVQFAKRLIRTALKPNFVETPDALRKSLASKILRKNP